MSERGNFRGRGGGARGGGGERGRGGASARGGGGPHSQGSEKPKKENILDLSKYMDKEIMVKFNGGRESELASPLFLGLCFCFWEEKGLICCVIAIVQGTLKGHDQLMNLVLDDVQEMLRGMIRRGHHLPNTPLAMILHR